ncbi:MAG: M20/M25/M40 family metallo-hydrolase, partial [Gemmatimonadetes bacterium]|nr:M20/M25/M40 family metallo-hydrolase [Gemmatimonadota bacterium]
MIATPTWMGAAALALAASVLLHTTASAQARTSSADRALAREIFAELIAIDSSEPPQGDPRAASEAMAARLRAAGFAEEDVQVIGPEPRLGNLVARYRGSNRRLPPILLMAHIDVVPARRDDWSVDPFTLTEQDGYFYGRGAIDNKAGAAMLVANLIRYRQEGFRPQRDLIVVLTADEETTGASIQWLLQNHPEVARAGFALNTDAGGGELREGRKVVMGVQASEKVYLDYQLEVRNPGGHSSRPRPDNAIYQLAGALTRLEHHRFPVQLNEVTRAYFRRTAELGGPYAEEMRRVAAASPDAAAAERLSEDPGYNAMLRTTCVATMLEAGHAENALPQTARAVVNCRILPGEDPAEVDRALREVVGDTAVAIRRVREPTASPPSPLRPEVLGVIERLTQR